MNLSASHDLNLLSQAEQHTQRQSQANAGGEVGVSIGQTTGIYATVHGGKGRTHGNGTTHLDTQVSADDTLSLFAGHDATIQGAQATGNTVLADIGHDLNIVSEQDTDDYASNHWQGSVTVVYGFSGSGAGVSGSASAGQTDSQYKSVTQTSGIAAGDGGYDIYVGHHTDLTGGIIASTAGPSKNLFSTGSLSYSDLQNEADYSAWSASVGGGYGTGQVGNSMNGFTPSGSIPQGKSEHSVTHAGIAQGTVDIRDNPGQDLSGLDRNPDIDAQGLKTIFDAQKVAENQEVGEVAGQVAFTSIGRFATHEQKNAAAEYTDASKRFDEAEQAGDTQGMLEAAQDMQDAKDQFARWDEGSATKVGMHVVAGALVAGLGGGDALGGAMGAGAGEALRRYDNGQNPIFQSAVSLLAGAVSGNGSGVATSLYGENYNRGPDAAERAAAEQVIAAGADKEKTVAVLCAVMGCANGVLAGSTSGLQAAQWQEQGQQLLKTQEGQAILSQLKAADPDGFEYTTAQQYWDVSKQVTSFASTSPDWMSWAEQATGVCGNGPCMQATGNAGPTALTKVLFGSSVAQDLYDVSHPSQTLETAQGKLSYYWAVVTNNGHENTASNGMPYYLDAAGHTHAPGEIQDDREQAALFAGNVLVGVLSGGTSVGGQALERTAAGEASESSLSWLEGVADNPGIEAGETTETLNEFAQSGADDAAQALDSAAKKSLDELSGETFEGPELGHTAGRQDGKLGEQLVLQQLKDEGYDFQPLQNASNHGADGVYYDSDTNTIWVLETKSSQNGAESAMHATGDPAKKLDLWIKKAQQQQGPWANQSASNKALLKQLEYARGEGAQIRGMEARVGVPKPGSDGKAKIIFSRWGI